MTKLDWRRANRNPPTPPPPSKKRSRPPSRRADRRPRAKPKAQEPVWPTDKQVAWLERLRVETPYLDDDVKLKIKARAEDARARGLPLTPLNKVLIETQIRQTAAAQARNGRAIEQLAWRPAVVRRPSLPELLQAAKEGRERTARVLAETAEDLLS